LGTAVVVAMSIVSLRKYSLNPQRLCGKSLPILMRGNGE
jgi:hypothetical protein